MVRNYPSAWPPNHGGRGVRGLKGGGKTGPELEEEEDLRLLYGAVRFSFGGDVYVYVS